MVVQAEAIYAEEAGMRPQEPWVMGSRVPVGSPAHLLVPIDPETLAAVEKAAADTGVGRIDFLRLAIDRAVRAALGRSSTRRRAA